MEASKLAKLTTCVFVLLNVIMVIDIDAMPGGYRRAHTPAIGSHSCSSMDQYACIQRRRKGIRCISKTQLCNGQCDCPLGEDEWFCHFMKPTVTMTLTATQTTKTTLTTKTTVLPVIKVNSTSTCTSTVTFTLNSLTTSSYAVTDKVTQGETVCSILTREILPAEGDVWVYRPTNPITTIAVSEALICSATTTYP